ncbi:hypothetical protein [Kitasatospora sp. NPDC008115]|uniref:hypothetical protein n=1 Tax=Kitasatospora sp. NPDC008115 TaxID=3364022 RepID=UPI0036E39511
MSAGRRRTLHLVEDLLEVSRLDAGAEQPVRVRVPLGGAVREAVARTGYEAGFPAAGTQTVGTDPCRLERTVGNASSTPTGTAPPRCGSPSRAAPSSYATTGRASRPACRATAPAASVPAPPNAAGHGPA